ncbi:hypothetical protein CIB84_006267 [Bambusicola thoracicus]|uniref:Chromodomain-helicase-DNA-binding protein 1-like C-terminal domain-containing protein n=1 Tax=Bambusicola thoracicus TaxID=9083 RepID=A0A2P4T0U9_BAMTH|nr:hypothetical protein CIB84_006267 [Bambusicola thoracicus]
MACTKFNNKDILDWKIRLEAYDGSVFVQIKLSMFSKAAKQEPRDKTLYANCGLDLVCKEYLRPFKSSLRKLHLPPHLSRKKKVKYMKESMTIIGDRINWFLQQYCRGPEVRHWKKMMWRFTSLFSDKDEKQLQKLYKYVKRNEMQKFQVSKQTEAYPSQRQEAELLPSAPWFTISGAVHGSHVPSHALQTNSDP